MRCEHRTPVDVNNSLRAWAAAGEPWHRCRRRATWSVRGWLGGQSHVELRCAQHLAADFTYAGALPGWVMSIDPLPKAACGIAVVGGTCDQTPGHAGKHFNSYLVSLDS